MAISKRLRFEILRRDEYTCRYCGASAPGVVVTVDHVIPVAMGGQDVPENLVAACRDCNAGKSSSTPDASLVAEVGAAARTYMLALQDGFTKLRSLYESEEEYIEEFESTWSGWRRTRTGEGIPRPDHWRQSVRRWHRIGVPLELIEDAIERAMKKRLDGRTQHDEFRYMAGIIWRTIDDIGSVETVTPETVKTYTPHEAEEREIDAWRMGWDSGYNKALEHRTEELSKRDGAGE